MVIGSKFPTDRIVSAHFDAIKYGLDHDIADQEYIIFYGSEEKASRVTAVNGGKIVGVKRMVRRRRSF